MILRAVMAAAMVLAGQIAAAQTVGCGMIACQSVQSGQGWVQGERLPIMTPWQVIPSWKDLELPKPDPTTRYIRVGDDILLQEMASGKIVELAARIGY